MEAGRGGGGGGEGREGGVTDGILLLNGGQQPVQVAAQNVELLQLCVESGSVKQD